MATKTIKMRIQFRRDTTENWLLSKSTIPAAGEPCYDLDLKTLRIGDGVTAYENLPVIGENVNMSADGKSIVLEDNVFKLAGFDAAKVGAYPVKNADGNIEWVVPSTEDLDGLKDDVAGLKSNVTNLQTDLTEIFQIIMPEEGETETIVDRVISLENKIDGIGEGTVSAKIDDAIKNSGHMDRDEAMDVLLSKTDAKAIYEQVKYEITNIPVGTLVDYGDKEIRVMVPANAEFVKQNVGETGNSNMYYMGFKAYAPEGAVSFKEGDRGVIIDEMFTFDDKFAGTDKYGRNYSICWLALASYNASSDTWTYFGKNSSTEKYIGWDYIVEWYNADGVAIASYCIRINLSNEDCHYTNKPYYFGGIMKEVETLIDEKVTEVESVYEIVEF